MVLIGKEEKGTMGGCKEMCLNNGSCFGVTCIGMTVSLVEVVIENFGYNDEG